MSREGAALAMRTGDHDRPVQRSMRTAERPGALERVATATQNTRDAQEMPAPTSPPLALQSLEVVQTLPFQRWTPTVAVSVEVLSTTSPIDIQKDRETHDTGPSWFSGPLVMGATDHLPACHCSANAERDSWAKVGWLVMVPLAPTAMQNVIEGHETPTKYPSTGVARASRHCAPKANCTGVRHQATAIKTTIATRAAAAPRTFRRSNA